MDKKKSITILRVLFACLFTIFALPISAQDVSKIQFCDKKYEYGEGKDSITLFFKVLDKNGEPSRMSPWQIWRNTLYSMRKTR